MKISSKNKINNFVPRALKTLSGLALLLTTGCPNMAEVNVSQLSNKNWFNGRTEEICEGDLQKSPLTFDYGPVRVDGLDVPLGFNAEIISDPQGKDSPIRVDYTWNKIADRTYLAKVTISDVPDNQMNWEWTNGGTWTLGFQVYDKILGPGVGAFTQVEGRPFLESKNMSYLDVQHFTVLKGTCNETLINQIDTLENTIENIGQEIQQIHNNSQREGNSPNGESYPDGNGEQQQTPIEQLLSETYVQFTDAQGNPLNVITTPIVFARFYIPAELEARILDKATVPASFEVKELGYTGAGDCFKVVGKTSPSKIGEEKGFNIYQSIINLSRIHGCPQNNEDIEARFGINPFGSGEIYYSDAKLATLPD